MRKLVTTIASLCFLALPANAADKPKGDDVKEYVAEANMIIKDFMTSLKSELVAALKAGGPANGIEVCKSAAPVITAEVVERHGWDVGRTALKVRNPDNKPSEWEREMLEAFVKQTSEGADPKTLSVTRIVEKGGEKTFRYMKVIPMGAKPCTTCHGDKIDPALQAKIKELYPEDEAVGFKPGEVRGAFTLSRKID